MAIYEIMDESLFISRFEDFKRVDKEDGKGGNFTYKGLRHLFEYLDDLSEETGEDIEFDCIALCCDYSEYNFDEFLNERYTTEDLNKKIREILDLDEDDKTDQMTDEQRETFKEAIEEEINDNTTLIKFSDDLDDGFIIQNY